MTVYWLMFVMPMVVAGYQRTRSNSFIWTGLFALFVLIVGLRYEVGGDWGSYVWHFERVAELRLIDVILAADFAYYGLNWLVAEMDGSVVQVNLICAAVMMWGVLRYCRSMPIPWVAMLVAVPFLIIVIGMGFTRQAVALGIILGALPGLFAGGRVQYCLLVFVAAGFHTSAIVMLPLAALIVTHKRRFPLAVGALVLGGLLVVGVSMISDVATESYTLYVESEYASAARGAAVRVLMNAVPAGIFLIFREKFRVGQHQRSVYTALALAAIACLGLLQLSATATDRISFYLIPLQLFVFSHFPGLAQGRAQQQLLCMVVVIYYVLVQFVWISFSDNSKHWLPYQNVLFLFH